MSSNKVDQCYCMKIELPGQMTISSLLLPPPSTLTLEKGVSPSPLLPYQRAGVSSPPWGHVECAPDCRMVGQSHITRYFWVGKMKVKSLGCRTASLQLDVQIRGLQFIIWWSSPLGTKIITTQPESMQFACLKMYVCLFFREDWGLLSPSSFFCPLFSSSSNSPLDFFPSFFLFSSLLIWS